jgi:hypothetical protein
LVTAVKSLNLTALTRELRSLQANACGRWALPLASPVINPR